MTKLPALSIVGLSARWVLPAPPVAAQLSLFPAPAPLARQGDPRRGAAAGNPFGSQTLPLLRLPAQVSS